MIVLDGLLYELVSDMRMETQKAGIVTCTERLAGCDASVPLHPSSVPFKVMRAEREGCHISEGGGICIHIKHSFLHYIQCTIYSSLTVFLLLPCSKDNHFDASMDSKQEQHKLHSSLRANLLFSLWRRKESSGSESRRVGAPSAI